MARFFFHVREGADLSLDEEGQDFSDIDAARREAINSEREMLSERLLHGGPLHRGQIEIADESGRVVEVVTAQDVLYGQGTAQSYDDDVTKSAPTNPPSR